MSFSSQTNYSAIRCFLFLLLLYKSQLFTYFCSFPLAIVRPSVVLGWREFLLNEVDARSEAVLIVIRLTRIKVVEVLHGRLVMMRRVCDCHMLSRRISRRWIRVREVSWAWNVIKILMRTCIWCFWSESNKIAVRRVMFLQLHRYSTWFNGRWIRLVFSIVSGAQAYIDMFNLCRFSFHTILVGIRIQCDFIVIFQFQSSWCNLRRFSCCIIKWHFFRNIIAVHVWRDA